MSLTKRIIDLARSNLNKLLEQAAATADPRRKLSQVSDEELEAELVRRRAAKQAEAKISDAKAQIEEEKRSAPLPKDREARERMAREREARVKAERAARQQQQQRQQVPPRQTRTGQGQGQAPPPRSATSGQNVEIARYYARLEITYGANWDEVKSAYRRLMRKYHPDLHAGKSPDKVKAANDVAAALTQAYNELEKHLKGGPNRSS